MRLWSTSRLDKPYHVGWRGAHAKFIVNSWGVKEYCDSDGKQRLWSYKDQYGDTKWERLVDCDWSSNFGIYGYSNSQNDGYWAETREEFYAKNFNFVSDNLKIMTWCKFFETSSGCFKGGVAMWGCVSVNGLYPKDGPFFRDEILDNDGFQVTENLFLKVIGL